MQHSDIDPSDLKPALADYVLDYAHTIPIVAETSC